jgi:hypothetical protein
MVAIKCETDSFPDGFFIGLTPHSSFSGLQQARLLGWDFCPTEFMALILVVVSLIMRSFERFSLCIYTFMDDFEMGRVDQGLKVGPCKSFGQLRHFLEAQVTIKR